MGTREPLPRPHAVHHNVTSPRREDEGRHLADGNADGILNKRGAPAAVGLGRCASDMGRRSGRNWAWAGRVSESDTIMFGVYRDIKDDGGNDRALL